MGGPARQLSESVGELADRLARLNAAQHHRLEVHPPAAVGPGGRSHVHGASRPAGGREPAEVGELVVDLQRQGVLAVNIGLDHRVPALLQVLLHLAGQSAGVHGQVAGRDQQRLVAALPELGHSQGHQPQHPPGALELVEGRPVAEKPVEQLGVDRVRQLHPPPVGGLGGRRREVAGLAAVHLGEGPDHAVAAAGLVGGHGVEQAAADDLEALVGTGRLPLGG